MFEKSKAKAAARRQLAADDEAIRAHAAWAERVATVEKFLEAAHTFDGFDEPGTSLVLKKGERVYLVLGGGGLAEPRRLPGQWQGGSQGVSFRVAKGVYWRTGGTRGTYSQGEERQTLIDQGTVVITNQRLAFLGTKQTREWLFTKLLGIQHDDELGATYIQVSNRQKVSGIVYGTDVAGEVQFQLDLAVSSFSGTRQDLVHELDASLDSLQAERPALPPPRPSDEEEV